MRVFDLSIFENQFVNLTKVSASVSCQPNYKKSYWQL